jgi:hypothetical protein
MRQVLASLFKIIGDWSAASQHKDYEKAASRIVAALDSGKLQSTDKAALATPIIDAEQPRWLSPFDGIDWIELHALAKEHKVPLETVNDLLSLLRDPFGKM